MADAQEPRVFVFTDLADSMGRKQALGDRKYVEFVAQPHNRLVRELLAADGTAMTESILAGNESSRTGTRLYAPPEAALGRPATTGWDVYALGVMLYQLAAGNLYEPLGVGWEDRLDTGDPDRTALLAGDIRDATMADPGRRLQTAAELAERLENLDARVDARRASAASAALERRAGTPPTPRTRKAGSTASIACSMTFPRTNAAGNGASASAARPAGCSRSTAMPGKRMRSLRVPAKILAMPASAWSSGRRNLVGSSETPEPTPFAAKIFAGTPRSWTVIPAPSMAAARHHEPPFIATSFPGKRIWQSPATA